MGAIVISANAAVSRYRQLLDRQLAAGGRVPPAVHQLALAGEYGEAIAWLERIEGGTTSWGAGKFAAEVAPLTEQAQTEMRNAALANIAAEVRGAGPVELAHFARMAEALCRTDLGARMQGLVDDERSRQIFTLALLPVPPAGEEPQAGPRRTEELPRRTPLLFDAVARQFPGGEGSAGLGLQHWAIREERWEQAGMVGHPGDSEFDDFSYQAVPGGEGGS
jgi:hypothetical protein